MGAVVSRWMTAHKPGEFDCAYSRTDGLIKLSLRGYLDEEAAFPDLEIGENAEVEVDFQDLAGMDTAGVMVWEEFCRLHPHAHFYLKNCPEFIVKNANFFPRFLPADVTVESFEVRHHCDTCERQEQVMFEKDRDYTVWKGGYGRLHTADEARECSCGGRLQVAENESKYFSFLKHCK